jgi:hypothetical protein
VIHVNWLRFRRAPRAGRGRSNDLDFGDDGSVEALIGQVGHLVLVGAVSCLYHLGCQKMHVVEGFTKGDE